MVNKPQINWNWIALIWSTDFSQLQLTSISSLLYITGKGPPCRWWHHNTSAKFSWQKVNMFTHWRSSYIHGKDEWWIFPWELLLSLSTPVFHIPAKYIPAMKSLKWLNTTYDLEFGKRKDLHLSSSWELLLNNSSCLQDDLVAWKNFDGLIMVSHDCDRYMSR